MAGAGIVECDVTFTNDGELVCRHSECDLHTTTNIVATPLNAKCTRPWTGPNSNPLCCTSDLTLAEYRTLRGKMDASVPSATTAEGYLGGTASWRTDLYTGRGTLMTVRESVAAQRAERRQAHARAEGRRPRPHRAGLRRAGPVRAEAGRRVACGPRRSPRRMAAVLQQGGRSLLGEERAGIRPAGGLPGQRRSHRRPARPAPDPGPAPRAARPGRALLRAAHAGPAGRGRRQPRRAVALRAGHQEPGLQDHHLDASSAPICAGARRGRASTTTSTRRGAPSRRTATCTRRSTRSPSR